MKKNRFGELENRTSGVISFGADERRGWVRRDGWWLKKYHTGFGLKFTEEAEKRFHENNNSELQLREVAHYATHVQGTSNSGIGSLTIFDVMKSSEWSLATLFDAMNINEPSQVQHISLQNKDAGRGFRDFDLVSLAKAIEGGCLQNLKCLELSEGRGHSTLAKAIAFGGLSSLKTLSLRDVKLTADETEEYRIALLSGKVPNLCSLEIPLNILASLAKGIEGGYLQNLKCLELSDGREHSTLAKAAFGGLKAIEGGCLQNLKCLELSDGRGHSTLAKAIASGGLSSLKTLSLHDIELTADEAEEYRIALLSGKVPNLCSLEIPLKLLVIAISPKWKNLAELKLDFTFWTDDQELLLVLADALKSGRLDSLKILDLQDTVRPSEKLATALVSAFSNNQNLTVDVRYKWHMFPELDRRKEQLIERNSRHRDILAGLVRFPKVQATIGKVYICGNPEVGKTTLCRTLQRSFWKSLITWETKPHVEKQTRGIDVSQLSSKGNKPGENPITLRVWDMAGQEDFHLIHNAFFPDLGSVEGKATTFIVVCNSRDGLYNSVEHLQYWLRYIASSCDKRMDNPRRVFVVMNNSGKCQKIHRHAEQWKSMLEEQRDKFKCLLEIQTDLFLVDVRKFRQVDRLKSCLLEHSRDLLRNLEVPNICQTIEKSLIVLSQQREQFPVLHWTEFVEHFHDQLPEYWPENILGNTIDAATKYLTEAGVLIYIDTEGVKLVVVDPHWFCIEIIGKVFLPRDMASPRELLFREKVDQTTGSISISSFKEFFKSFENEWNDAQVDDMIAILLWLGLCYKGKEENVFIPALIATNGTPADPWCLQTQVEDVGDQWVRGFSVRHKKSEVTLAPISLWHRFQVDLAQTLQFHSDIPGSDFVADKYFMTFVKDDMNVLIEVDTNLDKPTFEEISILVKQRFEKDQSAATESALAATERKQRQVDLANNLVEKLLKLWNQVCPGVEYEHRAIWPWPASWSRPKDRPERNVEVAKVKKWVLEHGVGRKMQWVVGSGDPITEDQFLSTKDKRDVVQSVEHSLSVVIQGMKEAVNLGIFPGNVLTDEVSFDESVAASDGIDIPTSSTHKEQGEMYMISKKLEQTDNKVDKVYKKLGDVQDLVGEGFGEVLKKQKQLLYKLQETDKMFLDNRQSICPKFIYLGTSESAWVTLKDALFLSKTVRLRFACEASYDNYRPHTDVKDQQGLDISQFTDWGRIVIPWLRVSLTVLFISAKVAANLVAPGVGLLLPSSVQWKQASSLSEGIASATGFSKDQLDKIIRGTRLNTKDAQEDPQGLYRKSRKVIGEVLGKLKPEEFEKKIGLRKVHLKYPDGTRIGVVWICTECFDKFPMEMVSEL